MTRVATDNSQLGFMIPAKSQTVYINETPLQKVADDDTYTWPITDWATTPGYNWIGDELGSTDGIELVLDQNYNLGNDEHFLYISCNTPQGIKTSGKYFPENGQQYSDLYLDDLTYIGNLDYDSGTIQPDDRGVFVCGQCSASENYAKSLILQRDLDSEGSGKNINIREIALFEEMSLPYNPLATSYTVTPVIPAGGEQSYTTMGGRRQKLVFSKVQYKINLQYQWSESDGTVFVDRLRKGLEMSLQNGTPILFIEPVIADHQRRAYLINLDSAPEIRQQQRGVYSVTINGVTQP